jgi:hypothetical protein
MATSNRDTARVTLPGRLYKKAGRWWWSVQLPGEARCRARALRGSGERFATSDRRTAETAALNLWQEALIRNAQAEITADVKTQSQEKSRAYAFLIDQMNEGPRLSFRQAPWTAPSTFQMQVASGTESVTYPPIERLPHHRPSSGHPHVTSLREPDAGVSSASALDVMEFLSERSSEQDRQGCECCDSKDFFDEYLQTVESGQKLCPRCIQAMRDDLRAAESQGCL